MISSVYDVWLPPHIQHMNQLGRVINTNTDKQLVSYNFTIKVSVQEISNQFDRAYEKTMFRMALMIFVYITILSHI